MSNNSETKIGTIKIAMNRAAMTEKEKKEFLEDLARISGIAVDEIRNHSFTIVQEDNSSLKP